MHQWNDFSVIFATRNLNKHEQVAKIFMDELNLRVLSLCNYPHIQDVEEDQDTFEGNACKKAKAACTQLRTPVIADDSGLVVPTLQGRPGVFSARYSGASATDQSNNEKLLKEMESVGNDQREAAFVCVMVLALPDGHMDIVRSELQGVILREPRGTGGFGYQPLFYLPDEQKTLAELSDERKHEIGHRALSTRKIIACLKDLYRFK